MKKKILLFSIVLFTSLWYSPANIYANLYSENITNTSQSAISFQNRLDIIHLLPTIKPTTDSAISENISISTAPILSNVSAKKKKYKWVVRYINSERVNVRKKPTTKSKILGFVTLNTKLKCAKYNKNWYIVKYKNKTGYISAKLLSKKRIKHKTYIVPYNKGFMSYMPYNLFYSSSPQGRLQSKYAYTGRYGIRQVNGRYCVAIGSHFTTKIGTYFDLILKNGTVIPCILADQKANRHTDSRNIITLHDGSVAEFIVNTSVLNRKARRSGNITSCNSKWKSPIKYIKVYKKRIKV